MSTNASFQMTLTIKVMLKARLTTRDGKPLLGKEIKFYRSVDAQTWSYIGSSYTNQNGEASIVTDARSGERFKAVFEETDEYNQSEVTAEFFLII
jgi:5-hydroxyisourate hydrolase-like protein (transthyretin family)